MPLIKCVDAKTGESGWKWGENGGNLPPKL